jgi:hypothetical protein
MAKESYTLVFKGNGYSIDIESSEFQINKKKKYEGTSNGSDIILTNNITNATYEMGIDVEGKYKVNKKTMPEQGPEGPEQEQEPGQQQEQDSKLSEALFTLTNEGSDQVEKKFAEEVFGKQFAAATYVATLLRSAQDSMAKNKPEALTDEVLQAKTILNNADAEQRLPETIFLFKELNKHALRKALKIIKTEPENNFPETVFGSLLPVVKELVSVKEKIEEQEQEQSDKQIAHSLVKNTGNELIQNALLNARKKIEERQMVHSLAENTVTSIEQTLSFLVNLYKHLSIRAAKLKIKKDIEQKEIIDAVKAVEKQKLEKAMEILNLNKNRI